MTSVAFLTRRLGAVLLILVAACSSSGRSDQEVTGPSTSVMPLVWECPAGYDVKEGLNTDFQHKGLKRAFVVYPARNAVGPVPVWVPLTGSVESTNDNLWYVTADDGSPLSFDDARAAVAAAPTRIHQGRVGPLPLPAQLGPMIVMTVWGGDKDLWNCTRPDGSKFLCADYRPSTQAGSNYFSSKSNVVHVACTAHHGHMWPQVNTQAFNLWALNTLASFPKGSDPRDFKLTAPPEGYRCRVGPFAGLY